MAKTIQKRIKFSKGQVSDELVERTDTDILDSSAQLMQNVVSTVYGGVRSRRGSKYVDVITSMEEAEISSITSNIYLDTSHFTDNTITDSPAVGTNRTLAIIDFGSTTEGTGTFQIKNIKIKPVVYEYTTSGDRTVQLAAGRYQTIAVGGGAGGNYNLDNTEGSHGGSCAGGSGAYISAILNLTAGTYTLGVGAGSTGKGGWAPGPGTSDAGGDTYIKLGTTDVMRCGGATAAWAQYNSVGAAVLHQSIGGTATINSEYLSESIEQINGANGEKHVAYSLSNGGASRYNSYGKGGSAIASIYVTSYANSGTDGYMKMTLLGTSTQDTKHTVVISTSTDGNTYTEQARETITQTVRDIEADVPRDRYLKVELVTDTVGEDVKSAISFQYMRENVSPTAINRSKLVPFVYNNTDKYLLCLVDGQIQIFKDDILVQNVTATCLDVSYLKDIKYSAKDDTIVFTHKSMHPKILKRTGTNTFTWGDLALENIPYALFGSETTTSKSVSITPSALEGAVKITASSSVFDSGYVGQYIDGNGGRVKVTEYTSATVVKGYTIIPFYTTDAISSWSYISGYEQVWSSTRGYPTSCLFAQQRLWFGGSKDKPATIWASRLGDYFNFKNSGNYDNDSIDVDLLTNDPILSMIEQRGIHVFTSGEEFTATEGTYTPDKFTIVKNTSNGSVGLQPALISGAVCFIEKNGKSLLSYVYDDNQAAFVSDNLSLFSNLIDTPIAMDTEINSSKDKGDFLYIVLNDGTMLVACIVLNQKVMSISKYETSGSIVGVCCVRDDVYLSVVRNGSLFIEKMIDKSRTDSIETRYISTANVSGLYRFNNKDVYVYSDKEVYGKYHVENNSITLDKIPYEECNIGIAFEYKIESNPVTINNLSTSIKKRITVAELLCKDTYRMSFCGQQKFGKDQYKFYACTPYGKSVKYNISGEFYPINILSVQLNINYEG